MYPAARADFNRSNLHDQLDGHLGELRKTLDLLEIESRIALSTALGSSVTAYAHRLVSIHEHAGPPSDELLKAVQEMMAEWVIDRNQHTPQYGFGRPHTIEELRHYLVTHAGRLFRLEAGGHDVGYYILFPDSRDFPEDVWRLIHEVGKTGEFIDMIRLGWTQLVGVTRAGRDWARDKHVDLYTILHEAVIDTLASCTVEKTFCIVRDGKYANLAITSHLRRGWRKTGAVVTLGELPYQILRLDVLPGSNYN